VSLNVALLGSAEIQSVNGLDELTGGGGTDLRWLYPVAMIAGALFAWQQGAKLPIAHAVRSDACLLVDADAGRSADFMAPVI